MVLSMPQDLVGGGDGEPVGDAGTGVPAGEGGIVQTEVVDLD